ncbi:MAG: inositol 2-dehydrogenase, partial [Rhizobiales bacterium]|nr:inositol 2-dehydrogenase [Hyphomicrobiales bacterium]
VEIANRDGHRREPLLNFFMTRYTEAYRNEIAAFIQAVEKGGPATPSGEDGWKALVLADAALQSVKEKRAIAVSI